MKRNIKKILVLSLMMIAMAASVFAWSQVYCPMGCRNPINPALAQKGVPSMDGTYLECPTCGHIWR